MITVMVLTYLSIGFCWGVITLSQSELFEEGSLKIHLFYWKNVLFWPITIPMAIVKRRNKKDIS